MTAADAQAEKTLAEAELIKRRNRRRMTWTSLISQCLVIALAIIFPDNAAKVSEIIIAHIIASSSVVAAYCGFSAWMSIKR